MSADLTRNISFTYDVANDVPSPVLQKCVVEFYRTKGHSNRKYGKNDNQYTGTFGFDRFDIKVCPGGMLQTPRNEIEEQQFYYPILGGCIPYDEHYKQDNTKIRKYLCPFLTIWPPKVEGNMDSEKSKVRIFVKAKRSIHGPKKGEYKIRFVSSNPNVVTINGEGSITLKMKINKKAQFFELKCIEAFGPKVTAISNDYFHSAIEINAYLEEKGVPQIDQANVGRLYIIPNRYIFYTELIPVIVRLKQKSGSTFEYVSRSTSDSMFTKIKDLCNNKLPDYLNKNAFNQSLIYFRYQPSPNIATLELNEDEFLKNMKSVFNLPDKKIQGDKQSKVDCIEEIEALYQSKLLNDTVEKRKIEAKETTQVNEKLKNYISVLKRTFSFDETNIETSLNNQVVGKAWNHIDVILARLAYSKAKSEYVNLLNGVDLTKTYLLDKKNKIHLFFFTDIEKEEKTINSWVPAFAWTYQGTGLIFTTCVTDSDVLPLITHEIGHTIVLSHTFEGEGPLNYEDSERRDQFSIQQEIERLQNQIKELQNDTPASPGIDKNQEYKGICQKVGDIEPDKFDIENDELGKLTEQITRGIELESPHPVSSVGANQTSTTNIEEETTSAERPATSETATDSRPVPKLEPIETPPLVDPDYTKKKIEKEMQIMFLKSRIAILEKELERALQAIMLNKITGRSDTLENFMDYKHKIDDTLNGGFEYKSFKFDQWRNLLISGVRKYLERKDVK